MTMTASQDRPRAARDSGGLLEIFKAIRKNWPIVLAAVLLAGGLAYLYSKFLPRIYQASALVEFDPNAIRPLADKGSQGDWWSYWDNKDIFETQLKIITSDKVLTRVVVDTNIHHDPAFMGPGAPANPKLEDVAARLRGMILVEPVKNTRLVYIRVEDTDARRARILCEAVATTYINQNLDKTVSATADAAVWLKGQVNDSLKELKQNEDDLHAFKEKNALPSTSINEASNMVRGEMQAYNEALAKTRIRKGELSARHAELSKISADNPDEISASELLNNPFLSNLRARYLEAVRDRKALNATEKGNNHPDVKRADEAITLAKTALLAEVRNIQGAVKRDLSEVERHEGSESGLFESARKRAVDLNMKEIEYHRLDRMRQQNEKMYGMLLERMKEADLARMMRVNNVRLVDPPQEPVGPVRPRTPLNVLAGLGIGLLLGIVLAWGRDALDSSIRTPADIEEILGITFLGLIPASQKEKDKRSRRRRPTPQGAKPELVVHNDPMSAVAEAARALRTNLIFSNPDKPHKTLLVTSAGPAEGKTTVACTIAIAFAQAGQRVCIVDCDLRRPRMHRIFDRVGDGGVTTVLVGDATVEEVAKPTVVQNLYCVPSGPTPPNAADVLHSARFKKFVEALEERFDRVIIDSPPVVPLTDAAIISTLVDGTVFVMRSFATTKAMSKQGLRALRDVESTLLGAVLNAVDLDRGEYSYYQHYYYYRQTGAEEAERAPAAAPSPPAPPPN